MDTYLLLKFAHIIGFILLGGGLLAVWVSEFQAYRTNEIGVFAESARYNRHLLRFSGDTGRHYRCHLRLFSCAKSWSWLFRGTLAHHHVGSVPV